MPAFLIFQNPPFLTQVGQKYPNGAGLGGNAHKFPEILFRVEGHDSSIIHYLQFNESGMALVVI